MLGLLAPQQGTIFLNGAPLAAERLPAWRAAVAHVPQSIFLAEDTILANIAFPRAGAELDRATLNAAIHSAALESFLDALPDGLETRVGERGVRLSGGQRQRIGIARALARRPLVLILDEATSVLDEQTESKVLAALAEMKGMTVVTVAHRRASLARCDRVLNLREGCLTFGATAAEPLPSSPRPKFS